MSSRRWSRPSSRLPTSTAGAFVSTAPSAWRRGDEGRVERLGPTSNRLYLARSPGGGVRVPSRILVLFPRLRKAPPAVQDLGARTIETHPVVPARCDGQAVDDLVV